MELPASIELKQDLEVLGDIPVFLQKIYHLISTCDTSIVHWSEDGKSFVIRNADKFSSIVIPKFFRHKNFSSFIRQLHFYGFRKIRNSPYLTEYEKKGGNKLWCFKHDEFIRGRPDLLRKIKRVNSTPDQQEVKALRAEVTNLKKLAYKMRTQSLAMLNQIENLASIVSQLADENQDCCSVDNKEYNCPLNYKCRTLGATKNHDKNNHSNSDVFGEYHSEMNHPNCEILSLAKNIQQKDWKKLRSDSLISSRFLESNLLNEKMNQYDYLQSFLNPLNISEKAKLKNAEYDKSEQQRNLKIPKNSTMAQKERQNKFISKIAHSINEKGFSNVAPITSTVLSNKVSSKREYSVFQSKNIAPEVYSYPQKTPSVIKLRRIHTSI